MSNRLHINRFKKEDLDNGYVSFGINVIDDYHEYTNDVLEDFVGENNPPPKISSDEFFKMLVKLAEQSQELDDLLTEHRTKGVWFTKGWLDGPDFDVVLEKAEKNFFLEDVKKMKKD